ncbi:S9 family peptidase [Kribbella deserti]|uniref:Prolyl oligopeptidase family serine peptidase n=1 Tax=Kribbella deserti TaxID=1926257 RepID=A0ABV6QL87_9ACTN
MNMIQAFPRQLARSRRFTLGVPRTFTISPDGRRVLFLRTHDGENPTTCLWLQEGGTERLLVDPSDAGDVPEAERVRRERARERATGIVGYSCDQDMRVVAYALNGRLEVLQDGVRREVVTPGPVVDPQVDPSGSRVAYVSDGALRVVELADGKDAAYAEPDGPEVTWGLAEHVASESMDRHRGYWWSPDGTRLLAARVDTSPVQRWWIADPANPAKPPREIAYPAAGTPNALVSLYVLDAGQPPVEVEWDHEAFEYLATASWDQFGLLLSVQSRDQKTVRVLEGDPASGRTRLLHEQTDPAWVELIPGTPARTDSGKLVHTIDQPETRRLVIDGEVVTPVGLQVRNVLDVQGESVLFQASDEPTETHLWQYDGGELRQLTEAPGIHTGVRAGGTLVITSRTERDGNTSTVVRGSARTTIASYREQPVVLPRITWLRAGATEIRTALLLPSWYQPGTALPVLMAPYGGAGLQLATRAGQLYEAQWFAENGYAVIVADGRGTPGRGPAWEKTVHGDVVSAPLEDQIIALEAAANHCADLDLGRVAIRGWSYGGTLAMTAVLRRPDVFHAAISGAGVADQRLYDTHWKERYLGHPDQQPGAYDRTSPIHEAANLTRPLLLIHGLADDNVIAAHVLRMSAALLAAGKPHEVLPLAGATHMPTDPATVEGLLNHQLEFLQRHLTA